MKDKLLKVIALGTYIGTVSIFGRLIYKNKKELEKFKFNYDSFNKIQPLLKQDCNESTIDFNIIKNDSIRKIVKDFYEVLEKDENVDLTNFKKNFKTLKFKSIKTYEDEKKYFAEALYDYYNNIIYYGLMIKPRVLTHELFHMASTIYDEKEKNVRYMGFGQDKCDREIGMGFTEAYTELLAKRFFGDKDHNREINDSYVIEMRLIEFIEKIVGKKDMMKFYFTADLKGLLNELNKYNDLDSVIEFITNVDEINLDSLYGNYLTKLEYRKKLKESVEFIVLTYANKLKYELYTKRIDEQELYKKIIEFANKLNNIDYIRHGISYNIKFMDEKDLLKLLKQTFGKYNIESVIKKVNKC